jgi:hypothetical protein
MAAMTEHSRLIAAAAKSALIPLGFKRRGQSRLYIADNRFWITKIEFQPSSFSKGSYLNCYAHWLWGANDHSFDYGGRVNGFVRFENAEQFGPEIAKLAADAAEAARKLLSELSSIETVATALAAYEVGLAASGRGGSWPAFNAAIANTLAENRQTAFEMFIRAEATPGDAAWTKILRDTSSEFGRLLQSEPTQLRRRLLLLISQGRARFNLPPLNCLLPGSMDCPT